MGWFGTECDCEVKHKLDCGFIPQWVKCSPSSASGESVIAITVEPNESNESRTGVLMIQGGGISKNISVVQKGKESNNPEPDPDGNDDLKKAICGSWVSTTHHFEYLEIKSDGTATYEWYINDKLAGLLRSQQRHLGYGKLHAERS